MKKTVRILAVALVLLSLAALLVSCKPSGKYVRVNNEDQYYEFDGDKVTVGGSLLGIIGGSITGTYEIDGDTIKITYTSGDTTITNAYPYEKSGNTIKIDGIEYRKQ